MRQEQEEARDEITEVARGILRLQLPIQFTGLGHVNCYAMEDERGFTIVDPGLPGPIPWQGLTRKLDLAGIPVRRIHTVVVTHSHPDHFGGAARVREESGADILTHRSFRLWFDRTAGAADSLDDRPSEALDAPEQWSRPTAWGTEFRPPSDEAAQRMREEMMHSDRHRIRPTQPVDDADVVRLGGREWVAMHTPGHTPDHLCLYDPEDGVVLSGDHVLPTITPHIGDHQAASADPLADFFLSLERMASLPAISVVLPAHGHPFHDMATRVHEIEEHHAERLERLRTAALQLGRPAAVPELMRHLFSERSWGSMAESETYAHLEHLRLLGEAKAAWIDGLLHYDVVAEPATASAV